MHEVSEHAEEPELMMAEMVSVLETREYIFITVPRMWGLDKMPFDSRRYTTVGIKKLLRKFKLNIILLDKENPEIKCFIKLVLSKNNNAKKRNVHFKYLLVKSSLLFIFTLYRIVKVKFSRIYISNQIFVQK